jgi:hypothetical protein
MQIAFTLPMLNFRPKVNQNAVHRAADQRTVFPARLKLDCDRGPAERRSARSEAISSQMQGREL